MSSIQTQIASLQSKLIQLHLKRDALRVETAKSYAAAFIRKLEADGIPLEIGLKAFKDLAKVSTPRQKRVSSGFQS